MDMLDKTLQKQLKKKKKTSKSDLLSVVPLTNEVDSESDTNGDTQSMTPLRLRKRWSIGGAPKSDKLPKELLDYSHAILAEQITIRQFARFKRIHPRECLKQAWKNVERKHVDAPNITKYIEEFNRLTRWIQSSILVAKGLKRRGRIIKKWVKIEEELYKLR